ncbi:MAG: hypothetical protein M3167_06435 [Acidobacteriota bacterium]|nr:hypothetical protein [Acidobacteriota bacterium]
MSGAGKQGLFSEHQTDEELLDDIERQAFRYFQNEVNEENGLIPDKTQPGSPASIAVLGLALASYPVGVERGFWTREEAVERTLTPLRFLSGSPQSREADATGYRGFYYHFLDLKTGRRTWRCELSTVDTALLIAGVLAAALYFDRDDEAERDIRDRADSLYRRIDWGWALNGGPTVSHGWKPETGFLRYRWEGYSEALFLYALALGSPTHPIPPECYRAWTSTYAWKKTYGIEHLHAGPLFIHQLSHVWIDFRDIPDEFMRQRGIDYFENSRRAVRIQREYAIRNPKEFEGYARDCWGLTASDGPGPAAMKIGGVQRRFYGYRARGAPFGPDDGTVSPWAVGASLPFDRTVVLESLRRFISDFGLKKRHEYGFEASFNPTFPADPEPNAASVAPSGWVSPWIFGLNQGPLLLMIENARTELIWKLMRRNRFMTQGLRRAGFRGAWLE